MPDKPSSTLSKSTIQTFKETIESLVIAFILAFVFRAFVVEAFVIPTGSMADTLRGSHFRLMCANCGDAYNVNFEPHRYGLQRGAVPSRPLPLIPPNKLRSGSPPHCPLCGYQADSKQLRRISNGDRILVLKYLYQFTDPKIWDVVVFKNPTNPKENYIKRLIGRPGEKVEIIDGDIYINGVIQTKRPKVQDALWINIWDNNYQPIRNALLVNKRDWGQPFASKNTDSGWTIDQKNHTFTFDNPDTSGTVEFNSTRLARIAKATIAYNGPSTADLPTASDLKLTATLIPQTTEGSITISLGKYLRNYQAHIEFNGQCSLINASNGQILTTQPFAPLRSGEPVEIAFACLDHTLQACIGKDHVVWQGPNKPEDWGYRPDTRSDLLPPPTLALTANQAKFTLKNITLYRDIHYTNNSTGSSEPGRATPKNPIEPLGPDEFFVMGDNSPASLDSRFWDENGKDNDRTYRMGIVPRDYLIGKAFFVYWPAGFLPTPSAPVAIIPNAGQMRFIH